MNFYDKVTEENALEWYREMPPHLRLAIDEKKAKFTDGRDCRPTEAPEIYKATVVLLKARPLMPVAPIDELDGYTQKQIAQFDALKIWGLKYNELLLNSLIISMAPDIQKSRELLSKAMGVGVDSNGFPAQAEGLDITTAATVNWLQQTGEMPLEFLARTYRNDEAKIGDRITAARTLMDYVHRKVPQKQEIQQDTTVSTPIISREHLRSLSEQDIATLEAILARSVKQEAK